MIRGLDKALSRDYLARSIGMGVVFIILNKIMIQYDRTNLDVCKDSKIESQLQIQLQG
jgi:hypothetical protein